MSRPLDLREINAQLEDLRNKRVAQLNKRIEDLIALRNRIDDELLVLADEAQGVDIPGTMRRRPRHVVPECGTESGYQRHRTHGETCDECKAAHSAHERVKSAQRRLRKLASAS